MVLFLEIKPIYSQFSLNPPFNSDVLSFSYKKNPLDIHKGVKHRNFFANITTLFKISHFFIKNVTIF